MVLAAVTMFSGVQDDPKLFSYAEQKKLGPCPISNHLKDLPYTSTFEMSPDAQLVGYLSQHTTHAVLQAKPEIDALMAK